MSYIKPHEVISPKAHWKLIKVLLDRGATGCAYALGEWDGRRSLGFRWNGNDENPIGNPQSRGLPTWTILDEYSHTALLALLTDDAKVSARHWLGLDLIFEAVSLVTGYSTIALWDLGQNPPVIAKIDCSAIKDFISQPTISDEECRLVVQSNLELITDLAKGFFRAKRYVSNESQCRVIEISADDLKPLAKQFSITVLETKARWLRL